VSETTKQQAQQEQQQEEYQTRLAIKLFTDKIVKAGFHAIPTEEDLQESKKLLDGMTDFALKLRLDKENYALPHLKFFADSLASLIILAEVGNSAISAMYKLHKIEQLRAKLAKQDECNLTAKCILKRGHIGECIV